MISLSGQLKLVLSKQFSDGADEQSRTLEFFELCKQSTQLLSWTSSVSRAWGTVERLL